MEKNICYRQRRRKEVVYDDCILEDSLSQGDWHIEEDSNYEMLFRGLRACAERASKPRTTNLHRISKTTKELLERRRALRLDPNASHIERDLCEYNIPLTALLSEDGTRTSSRRDMEIITERFSSNLFRSSTPVSSPIIHTAFCYAAKKWADTAATSRKLLTTHRALERCLLKFNRRTQHLAGLRSSDLRGMSRLRDPAEYISKAKHIWVGHIMRRIDDRWTKRTLEWIPRDTKRLRGRQPTRWGYVFATRMDQLRAQLDTTQGPRQRH
ncbi:hypothetical protein RB195_022115 [Necator americanus]|uniref:SCP-like protein n=1 Tax=Necator americanus TaxID=51031 RepID=A0ABR1EG83_NECAM